MGRAWSFTRLPALVAFVLLAIFGTRGSNVEAVEPGVNCASYDGDMCVVTVGDSFFCDAQFIDGECPTSIRAGDTVRWEYPSDGMLFHTTRECALDCDSPVKEALWSSGLLDPGDRFEHTFDTPGDYSYYCTIHPTQRGMIRVLSAFAPGDVNCDDAVNSIDAALLLQLGAGLLGSLPCPENADVDASGVVDSIDAALVLQYTAGLLPSLPP